MKICYLTSVHNRRDTRIFILEVPSLVEAGHDVTVIIADGKGSEKVDGVDFIDVGVAPNRISRFYKTTKMIYHQAIKVDATVYHFHDPELIPAGLKLLNKGKKVIYDIHEDVPRDILSKAYIPPFFRKIISHLFELYENYACRKFTYLIAGTPFLQNRVIDMNPRTININAFPRLNELVRPSNLNVSDKKRAVCYIGQITQIRAAEEMVRAMKDVDGKLYLAGKFIPEDLRNVLVSLPEWEKVIELGFIDRQKAAEILAQSVGGLILLYPEPNHVNAQSAKLFEYMSAGIPVICSNFPLWKELIEGNQCGICVDPLDPESIGKAITYLLDNPHKVKEMGENGSKAAKTCYNWHIESRKLVDLYNTIDK